MRPTYRIGYLELLAMPAPKPLPAPKWRVPLDGIEHYKRHPKHTAQAWIAGAFILIAVVCAMWGVLK